MTKASASKELFQYKELKTSWSALSASFRARSAVGVDAVSVAQFKANVDITLARVSKQLLSNSYEFSKLRPIGFPKSDGGVRLINVPTVQDRFIQRVLLVFLIEKYGHQFATGVGFGALRSGSVTDALKAFDEMTTPASWVVKTDISKFFDRIPRAELMTATARIVRHRSLHDVIWKSINCETDTSTFDRREAFGKAGLTMGIGLRQGMPISPLLAHLYLIDVDRWMLTTGVQLIRYVDDIVIVAHSKAAAERSYEALRAKLEDRGLSLPDLGESKSVLCPPRSPVSFLGLTLHRSNEKHGFYIGKDRQAEIIEKIRSNATFADRSNRVQLNWVSRIGPYISNIVSSYKYHYKDCKDWRAFQKRLIDCQVECARRVAQDLARLSRERKQKDKLLRAFGIDPRN